MSVWLESQSSRRVSFIPEAQKLTRTDSKEKKNEKKKNARAPRRRVFELRYLAVQNHKEQIGQPIGYFSRRACDVRFLSHYL